MGYLFFYSSGGPRVGSFAVLPPKEIAMICFGKKEIYIKKSVIPKSRTRANMPTPFWQRIRKSQNLCISKVIQYDVEMADNIPTHPSIFFLLPFFFLPVVVISLFSIFVRMVRIYFTGADCNNRRCPKDDDDADDDEACVEKWNRDSCPFFFFSE